MIHFEGYSLGCVLVGLEAMDAAPEKDGDDVDGKRVDRLCDLVEELLKQRSASETEDEDPDGDLTPEYELGAKETPKPDKFGAEMIPISSVGERGNVNPTTARDARVALQNLRNLRGFIEANGDRKAKDAYNDAVRALRSQITLGEKFNPRASAYDSRSRRRADAADFEARAARFHGKAIKVHGEMPADDHKTRAEDAMEPELTFDQAVEKARQQQIDRWTPKKRR